MRNFHYRTSVLAVVLVALSANVFAQKADPAEVVAKHRAAVGGASEIAAVKNQLIVSNAQFTFKGSANVIEGKALVLSTPEKSWWGMNFASNDYPQDRFGFDGKTVKVAKATPNARSLIGDFLFNNREILREGLLGGTLSAAWPLLSSEAKNFKLKSGGTKTIEGKETIVLEYTPKSGDITIKIYFDSTTHRHVRTEYTLVRAAAQGATVDSSAGQSGAVYRLVEDFSNYSKMGQLMLPSKYKLTYSRTGTAATASSQTTNREAVWSFAVTDVGFNRELDENAFNVEAK